MSDFKSIPGGICAPKGFSAAGVHCGIRHNHSKLDLALIKADVRCAGAGCYTTNKVYGAPITVDREHLKDGYARHRCEQRQRQHLRAQRRAAG